MSSCVAVSSVSFSKNEILRSELTSHFDSVRFNETGRILEGNELLEFFADAAAAIVGTEIISADLLKKSSLKAIVKYGVGMDNVDREAMKRLGVTLGWTAGVNAPFVAEHTLGLMIMLLRNLGSSSRALSEGKWIKDGGVSLSHQRVGIIGVGHVGKALIKLLQPFGCEIWVNDLLDETKEQRAYYSSVFSSGFSSGHSSGHSSGLSSGLSSEETAVHSKEEIFAECDVVSLHVPLTPLTRHLVNPTTLAKMKSNAVLINTARGAICDNLALAKALAQNQIKGAGIDVFESEPQPLPALLACKNLIVTPHIAGNSTEAVLAMGRSAIEHCQRLLGPK